MRRTRGVGGKTGGRDLLRSSPPPWRSDATAEDVQCRLVRIAVRIAVREHEDVGEDLGVVPQCVRHEVAEAARHSPSCKAREPREKGDDVATPPLPRKKARSSDPCTSGAAAPSPEMLPNRVPARINAGSARRDAKPGDPSSLSRWGIQRHVDRVRVRVAGEPGVRIGRQEEVRRSGSRTERTPRGMRGPLGDRPLMSVANQLTTATTAATDHRKTQMMCGMAVGAGRGRSGEDAGDRP